MKKTILLLFPFLATFNFCPLDSGRAAEIPAGRLLNPQGSVGVLPAGKATWEEARNGRDLFGGDSIRTGPDSRASVLCVDETQLRINENTLIVLKGVAPSARMGIAVPTAQTVAKASRYEVKEGEIRLRNKNMEAGFQVETPAVTAAIRGTEFNLRVNRAGATNLVLLEGKLLLSNPQGQIDLDAGEEGFAEVGRAPVKRVVLQPEDAVQWSLYYPGIFSYRDIPLGEHRAEEAASANIKAAQTAYDTGDLDGSEQDADRALAQDQENGQALVILGWIYLQRQEPAKALSFLERARKTGAWPDLTLSGLSLALYRTGKSVEAYKLITEGLKEHASSLTLVMAGYFSMLIGKIEPAKAFLSDPAISGRDQAMARSLLAQIYLVQNRKKDASREASSALSTNRASPMALMTEALVRISYFDLPEAERLLEESIAKDPRFVEAYVYLARLQLGADYLDRAWKTISKALEISKNDSEVLSLAGFIRLGYRDYDRAFRLFNEAVASNPGFGEPHIGLSNIAFRNREFGRGLTEMLTATLLEPRVSLYESSLGKALYQTKSFKKALEVYDYAKTLDPKDPTPYLYKGIALSDLYRPGDAIQEINKSIELNDNRAVFRSRLMLDRDLAVRNSDLALAYSQLGLTDWSYSKAVTAVKRDPLNPSAHLFLSSAYASTNQRTGAAGTELLLYELLSPANENTFTLTPTGRTTDYTQMFEMPYVRASLNAGMGTWADHHALRQDYSGEVLGGRPGLALDAFLGYSDDPGFRKINNDTENINGFAQAKFEPTVKDSIYLSYQYDRFLFGDIANPDDFSYQPDPNLRDRINRNFVDSGYIHRFSPAAVFIGYFKWGDMDLHEKDSNIPLLPHIFDSYKMHTLEDANTFQLQQQLILGQHTVIAGFNHLTGSLDFSRRDVLFLDFPPPGAGIETISKNKPPERDNSVYVRDYWRISPHLMAELGISGDFISSIREGFPDSITSSTANPAVGLNYEINQSNTLRLAYQGYVISPSLLGGGIVPSEVAGFPSQINAEDGSKVKELGVSWESQWNPLTFSVLRLQAHRIETPELDLNENIFDTRTERFQGSFVLNRLLTSSLGLSVSLTGKAVDLSAPSPVLSGDFSEINAAATLSYMHPSGWFASIRDTVVEQDLGGLSDKSLSKKQKDFGNPFNLVDLGFGKYFPNKRGLAALELDNLLNQHFFYETEPIELSSFFPDRSIMFRIALYF